MKEGKKMEKYRRQMKDMCQENQYSCRLHLSLLLFTIASLHSSIHSLVDSSPLIIDIFICSIFSLPCCAYLTLIIYSCTIICFSLYTLALLIDSLKTNMTSRI